MAIEQRGKNTWRIIVYRRKAKGKYEKVTETFKGLKSEAKEKEMELKKRVKSGGIIIDKKITFSEFTEEWITRYAINLAPKTLSEYKKLLKKINLIIGDIPLCQLKPLHLTDFYNKLRRANREQFHCEKQRISENTVSHYYTLINSILNKAVKWEVLEKNPNLKVTHPKVPKHEPNFYDVEQVRRLLFYLEKEPLKTQAVILLTLDTGARRGEITGLDWDNVDLEKGTIYIKKSTQVVDGKIIEKMPKNNSSIRRLPITNRTLEVLKKYKEEQIKKELESNGRWELTYKVFTTEKGGYMHPDTPSKMFNRILKKYNLPKITFHELRHTSVSLLINAGVQTPVISKRVGHSMTSTTLNIYSHIFNSAQVEVINAMSDILESK